MGVKKAEAQKFVEEDPALFYNTAKRLEHEQKFKDPLAKVMVRQFLVAGEEMAPSYFGLSAKEAPASVESLGVSTLERAKATPSSFSP